MSDAEVLGVGGRLGAEPAKSLVESAFRFEIGAAPYLARGLSHADLAHLAMLIHVGIVPSERGVPLLRQLLQLHQQDPDEIELDMSRGDLYTNRAHGLRRLFGEDAGLIHSGRARREATTIAWQLACRDRLWQLWGALVELGEVILEVARDHSDTYMPDFTYLHHAHPTTLAHYLMGYAYPISRDVERVSRSLKLINRSPAGSGSVNGSQLPLDRGFLADLLAFEALIEHTRDAMWAPDMAIETMSTLVMLMTTIDRLAEELQIWTTDEFGFVELDDAHSRVSVIMPQKKNPYALAFLRGEARSLVGRWTSVTASSLTPSGQPDNRIIAYQDVPQSLERVVAVVGLLADLIRRATFDRNRMSEAARSGYPYASDMADYLVLATGLDDAALHRVLGRAVRNGLDKGGLPITAEDIRRAAVESSVDLPAFSDQDLERLRAPEVLVALRDTVGGAGRRPMAEMMSDLDARLREAKSTWESHPVNGFEERFVADILQFMSRFSESTK